MCTAVLMLSLAALFGGPVRLVMFLAGMLLFEAMQARVGWVPPDAMALLVLVLGLSSTLVLFSGFAGQAARTAALAFSFFVACLVMFARPEAWLARSFGPS